jgi:AbrB family looped-hinge helix DNA binding protein
MTEKIKIGKGGRIVIPAELRKSLDMHMGEELLAEIEDGALKLYTCKQAIESVREQLAEYLPKGKSLADELIEERRNEARRES